MLLNTRHRAEIRILLPLLLSSLRSRSSRLLDGPRWILQLLIIVLTLINRIVLGLLLLLNHFLVLLVLWLLLVHNLLLHPLRLPWFSILTRKLIDLLLNGTLLLVLLLIHHLLHRLFIDWLIKLIIIKWWIAYFAIYGIWHSLSFRILPLYLIPLAHHIRINHAYKISGLILVDLRRSDFLNIVLTLLLVLLNSRRSYILHILSVLLLFVLLNSRSRLFLVST